MPASREGSDRGESRADGAGRWRLVAVFGLLAFLQGVDEPTEGLVAQPLRSRLQGMGRGAGEIAWFSAVLGLPWGLKPLLGLLTDAVPLGGSRRRGYLAASGVVAAAAFLTLAAAPGVSGSPAGLLGGLIVASVAVTLADVTTDALVVEWGQVDGRTGRYQSAQWFCLYASGIITGTVGGALSARGESRAALVVSAAAAAAMFGVAAAVREPPIARPAAGGEPPAARGRQAVRALGEAARSPGVLAVAGFLALGNFNPFMSSAVLQLHMTGALGFGEQFFGTTLSVLAVASMVAAAAYGGFSRFVPLRALAHASVVLGVVSNLAYAGVSDRRSAVVATVTVGLSAMTATLVQFELAARASPPAAAATVFATFMAVSNLSAALATWLSGLWYETAGAAWGRSAAFQALTLAGAASTAAGWLLVPFLPIERFEAVGQEGVDDR
jgi:hypothetical protein